MASYRRAAWHLCWWGCLFGVLQVAQASERISVPLPSVQDLLNRANPVINENSLGYVQAHDSAFQYQQRSYSAPIKQSIKIPTPAIKDALKGSLKSNAAAVAVQAAVAAAVAGAGWVIDYASEPPQPIKKGDGEPVQGSSPSDYKWYWTTNSAVTGASPAIVCKAVGNRVSPPADTYKLTGTDVSKVTDSQYSCQVNYQHSSGDKYARQYDLLRDGSSCPENSTYSSTFAACVSAASSPVTDADYDSLDTFINAQSAKFRADLAKQSCEGSLAPARCFQALQDAASFLNSGPSSIQGPKNTSMTTSKNADGTVTNETTTRDTKFDMKYDGTGATATPNTTTTKTDGKGGESVTTEKEDEDSSTGTAPKPDDEKEAPSPCTTNCDGPAYKDLYTKTDVTKEGVLDTYAAKVKALPIMSAVGNFFTVSGGGSCPVWSGTIDIGWGQSVTLSNDFACQPWFTALSPAFHAVLMLVAAWLAFRVSILD